MLDQRAYQFLEKVIMYHHISMPEVMMELNLSERQFHYLLEKANSMLSNFDLPSIEMKNQMLMVDEKVKGFAEIGVPLNVKGRTLIISEEDRPLIIYLYTFIKEDVVSSYHYQFLLKVSKNTALADVKKAKEICQSWNIQLVYKRMAGYVLEGDEMDKRRFAIYCIDYLLSQPLGKEILVMALKSWDKEQVIIDTQMIIEDFLKSKTLQLVKSRKVEMIYHLIFMRARHQSHDLQFTGTERDMIEKQQLFQYADELTQKLFSKGYEKETYFTAIQLLTSQEKVLSEDNTSLQRLAKEIIDEFEKNTLLPIKNKAYLIDSLFNHLVPTYFRITFEMPLINPMTERIKEEYKELFQFVKRSLRPLSIWTEKQISEAEIGYFTLHFGGYLEKYREVKSEQIRALIVCSNGISSSIMLRAQLNAMFPSIHFTHTHAAENIQSISPSSYDVIFSTVQLTSIKPLFIVKPLLSLVEKNHLIQAVSEEFPELNERHISVDQVMSIIRKHTDIKNEKRLISELVDIMYFKNTEKRWEKPMLSDLLTEEMIHFTNEKLDWKTAIHQAAEPLVKTNKVEKRYVTAMIQNVEEVGTYIYIGKGIAIPHARPDAGVNEVGMSFLRTRKPVLLLDQEDYPVDLIICLAAIDNEAHLKALAHLTKLLGNESTLQAIKNTNSAHQLMEIIKEGEDLS
ncbi:BglG family transcription antiterminator [Salipaludibacillus agaradhaerens]|uniref:BglG family transcription antiterminator n=1 Tax=Salipaludibacillus agaradhaerens TaxID=76935 RepID=UPI0021511ED8|nr:BglG family transcription antiterminator [Salipaludibacillus agaradhaerens]MCR6105425.1 BglG family transcription antiterminator [Salipaludibacillus agaradhaerens]MCR6117464.1 BglG family transcription antiterminator [Salipaludibacillus agaradhaerens]UJW56653.1 BglG family transcription antiterminator [Bacillus sp. A116_S68]